MKKVVTFGILGCVLALIFGTMAVIMRSKTAVLESIGNAEAMWDNEKLFVVVQKRVAVQRTNKLLRKLSQLSGILFPQPRFLPEDLIVFQAEGGTLKREEHRRVGRVGGIIPFKGQIYFLRGSEPADYPYLHRLAEGQIVRVPREEAKLIVDSFELETELLKREGWQKRDLYFTEGQAEYPVEQMQRKMKLVLSKSRRSGTVRIELVDEESKGTQTLYELSSRARDVDDAEARQLNAESKGAQQHRLRL